jgi:hypothetical protein
MEWFSTALYYSCQDNITLVAARVPQNKAKNMKAKLLHNPSAFLCSHENGKHKREAKTLRCCKKLKGFFATMGSF